MIFALWFALLYLFLPSNSFVKHPQPLRLLLCQHKLSTGNESDDLDNLLATVSEAEALLACRSYLQRRNRLGEWNHRKVQQIEIFQEAMESDSTGFFWADPDELAFYDRKRRPQSTMIGSSSVGEDAETCVGANTSWPLLHNSSLFRTSHRKRRHQPAKDTLEFSDVWEISEDETSSSTYFHLDEETPANQHTRRSESALRMFSDPKWKALWYQSRWGNHRKPTDQERKERILHKRVLPLAGLLSHPELAAMDEDEIANAIRIYRKANLIRSEGVRMAVARRRNQFDFTAGTEFTINTTMIARNSLFSAEAQELVKRQDKRAESAKRAYETRRRREKAKEKLPVLGSSTLRIKGRGPYCALQRINDRLLEPSVSINDPAVVNELKNDLRQIMIPIRLSRRAYVLRRMLSDLFDMRGKCIPDKNGGFAFASNAPIQDLADLIDKKLTNLLQEFPG